MSRQVHRRQHDPQHCYTGCSSVNSQAICAVFLTSAMMRKLTSAMMRHRAHRSLKDFRNCRVLTELYLRKNNVSRPPPLHAAVLTPRGVIKR